MAKKVILFESNRIVEVFRRIPAGRGGVIEIADYDNSPEVEQAARPLTAAAADLAKKQGLWFIRDLNSAYRYFEASCRSGWERVNWLIYGGMFSCCLWNAMAKILWRGPELAPKAVTWVGLPLFAINQIDLRSSIGQPARYEHAQNIVERLAQYSLSGRLCSGDVDDGKEYDYYNLYYSSASRVSIREDGKILRVLNPAGTPSFVLDFYSGPEAMFQQAFRGTI